MIKWCLIIILPFFQPIQFQPTWLIADPICTLLFSVIVLCTTLAILRDALHVLMEGKIGTDFPGKIMIYKIKHEFEIWIRPVPVKNCLQTFSRGFNQADLPGRVLCFPSGNNRSKL